MEITVVYEKMKQNKLIFAKSSWSVPETWSVNHLESFYFSEMFEKIFKSIIYLLILKILWKYLMRQSLEPKLTKKSHSLKITGFRPSERHIRWRFTNSKHFIVDLSRITIVHQPPIWFNVTIEIGQIEMLAQKRLWQFTRVSRS